MTKALVGKQKNLPAQLKAKIEAAPESPAKKYKSDAQRKAVHASKADKKSPARFDPKKMVEDIIKPKAKVSYNEAYEKRDMKTYGNLNKEDYVKEAKRQNKVKSSGVDKKGGTYDVPKKPMSSKSATTPKKVETKTYTQTPKGTTKTEAISKNTEKNKQRTTMSGKKTLGDTKLGNLKVGKNGKRLADTKAGKAFSKARAKAAESRAKRKATFDAAKAERKAKRDAKKSPAKKYASYEQQKAVYASKADGGKGNPNKMKHKK